MAYGGVGPSWRRARAEEVTCRSLPDEVHPRACVLVPEGRGTSGFRACVVVARMKSPPVYEKKAAWLRRGYGFAMVSSL